MVGADGLLSNVTTATYLFLDDVLHQSDTPEGYPLEWGSFTETFGTAPADYGMDQGMANDPVIAAKIKEGLLSIPVLSIVTDKDYLFSHENDEEKGGIYIFTGPPVGDPTGNGWTRPVSAELFGCDHDFSVTCGLRLHGGHGRLAEKNPKHSRKSMETRHLNIHFLERMSQRNTISLFSDVISAIVGSTGWSLIVRRHNIRVMCGQGEYNARWAGQVSMPCMFMYS